MSKSEDYERWLKLLAERETDITIVDQGEGEKCDAVICRLKTEPLLLPDNLVGSCSKCFRLIQFRPHVPKRPAKMCDECAAKAIAAQGEELHAIITHKTARDIADYRRKKKLN